MPEFVMVPVPSDRVMEVYAILARDQLVPEHSLEGGSAPASLEPAAIDDGLIARAYNESSEAMKRFLDYLAERPGQVISSRSVGPDLGMSWNTLAGTLGAFGRRWHNRYDRPAGHWFFDHNWNFEKHHQEYRISEHAAAVVKQARSGT